MIAKRPNLPQMSRPTFNCAKKCAQHSEDEPATTDCIDSVCSHLTFARRVFKLEGVALLFTLLVCLSVCSSLHALPAHAVHANVNIRLIGTTRMSSVIGWIDGLFDSRCRPVTNQARVGATGWVQGCVVVENAWIVPAPCWSPPRATLHRPSVTI